MEPQEGHLSSPLCPSCHVAGFEVGALLELEHGPLRLVSPPPTTTFWGQFRGPLQLNKGDRREGVVQGCAPSPPAALVATSAFARGPTPMGSCAWLSGMPGSPGAWQKVEEDDDGSSSSNGEEEVSKSEGKWFPE